MPAADLDATPPRPRPILDAVKSGAWVPILGALVTAGVAFGALTAAQGSALQAVGVAVAGLLTATTAAYSSARVVAVAEPKVTPTADPRDDYGRRLVPEGQS